MTRQDLSGDTQQWVEKVHDTQAKDEKNRRTHGDNHPAKKLPNKRH
ncbi:MULTISPECIES: DUF4023 domain-containing protein [Paenibacillus]|nr:DUF4023 domain-containing protein [Paenibacillus caseinilyticus]MCZ8521096.1 DUF4023 domain-containing protein [Paenibacillus caseinilyticus]